MDSVLAGPIKPKFRDGVRAVIAGSGAEITFGARHCAFDFPEEHAPALSWLFRQLETGGLTPGELESRAPEIAVQIPRLLVDLDRLRLLHESDPRPVDGLCSGLQLYREVRRMADRTTDRLATSAFYRALVEHRVTREQLVGYALEYYVIVVAAPGLIGPALSTAHTPAERALIQDFLKSELGHDRFLSSALGAVGVPLSKIELHQPLPSTFALCASLGVYARQHPLSFKASLFLFERAQPDFIDAFDDHCRHLELPQEFYMPLRRHAEINSGYDHEDISRELMALEGAVDLEAGTVVKRHVSILVETLLQQEAQILEYYGRADARIPRIFD